ncbi:hypothetical protein HanHA89_Chr02g0056881 [Helianthus annuus]|nr:hypothetical protein HanHA89_Chr02g0056881 [Helianthus annuus]
MGFLPEWGAQFLTPNSTAIDAPPGYIPLYAAFFREGNFRLPFTAEALTNHGLHISQINALGLPSVTHFEFICRANRVKPTFEMFNVFYMVTYTGGFYSFNSRTSGVIPCSSNPPKSLHDWKQKFFYIRRCVSPVDMRYRAESEGIPKVTHKATSISQLEERALVGAGMSMLWVLKNPLGVPVYGYQGKRIYSSRGETDMDGQIRYRFLHPTSESFGAYANTVLGEDSGDGFDDTIDPTREEVIVLSSEGSDRFRDGLTPHSPCAGPTQEAVNEPVDEPTDVDDDVPVETVDQLETRRKKKLDKSEEKEKRVEENVTKTPRKRLSTLPSLDYVVVSDTLSGLDAGEKRVGRDPDDSATLTKMMRKKALEEKKWKLDEQAAAVLAAKRAKLQKEAPPAPSESEVDLGAFTETHGNLLEKIYVASGSRGTIFFICLFYLPLLSFPSEYLVYFETGAKSSKTSRKVDVSKITPPASPPSRVFGLSPSHDDLGEKKKQGDVEIEQVGEGGVGGAGGDGATPRHTIYTRRPQGAGGGATSKPPQSPEFENIHVGSWDTHNSACDDLPYAPRWRLTQGSRMSDRDNFHEFFSLSLPPAERLFQKRRNRFDLLDDHIHAEKKKVSDEAEHERVASQKREEEYLQRIAKLEKFAEEKIAEVKASELLAEEVYADCKWLLAHAVPRISERIVKSHELADSMFELGQAGYNNGRKDGYSEGRAAATNNEKNYHFELYKEDCAGTYAAKRRDYKFLEFGIVKAVDKLSPGANAIEVFEKGSW